MADGFGKKVSLRGIHKVPLEGPGHGLRHVDMLCVVCSIPQLVPIVLVSLIGLFSLTCQVSRNILGMSSRLLRQSVSKDTSNCEVAAWMPIALRLVGSSFSFSRHQEVISPSVSRMCLSFFASSVAARGLSFHGTHDLRIKIQSAHS